MERADPRKHIGFYKTPFNIIRVRGSSNGLTNHPGRDYRGLLMHAGLLLCCRPRPTGGSGLTSSRALGSTVRLLRSNGDTSMGLDDQAIQ